MEGGWHIDAERRSGPEVQHQLERGRLHDRQFFWLRAPEDAAGIDASLPIRIPDVGSVAHEPTGGSKVTEGIDSQEPSARRESDDLFAMIQKERICSDKERVRP